MIITRTIQYLSQVVRNEVMPVDSPTVAKAETVSNRYCRVFIFVWPSPALMYESLSNSMKRTRLMMAVERMTSDMDRVTVASGMDFLNMLTRRLCRMRLITKEKSS